MKRLILVLAIVVGVVVLLFGSVAVLSESSEVVVLHTTDPQGRARETRLWVVEDAGHEWLRAGNPGSAWYTQLRANPDVSLTRGDATRRYRAVPFPDDAAARDRVNALMEQKYGLPDRLIALMADRNDSVPIRLDLR